MGDNSLPTELEQSHSEAKQYCMYKQKCGRPPQTGSKVGISHFALQVKRSIFLGSYVWNEWTSVNYNFTSRCPIELVEVSF